MGNHQSQACFACDAKSLLLNFHSDIPLEDFQKQLAEYIHYYNYDRIRVN